MLRFANFNANFSDAYIAVIGKIIVTAPKISF